MSTIDAYLDALASAAPVPGGGSAAALVAAHGAALVAMVARITQNSAKFAAVHAQATIFAQQADELRGKLRTAGAEDERAYDAVRRALSLPKNTDEEKAQRAAAREAAFREAAEAPLCIAELAAQVALVSEAALALGNHNLESDLLCAAEFAIAGTNAAAANVLVNHQAMKDEAACQSQQARLLKACNQADVACTAVRSHFVTLVQQPTT